MWSQNVCACVCMRGREIERERKSVKKRRNEVKRWKRTETEPNHCERTIPMQDHIYYYKQILSEIGYEKYFAHRWSKARDFHLLIVVHLEFANERSTSKKITEVSLITIRNGTGSYSNEPNTGEHVQSAQIRRKTAIEKIKVRKHCEWEKDLYALGCVCVCADYKYCIRKRNQRERERVRVIKGTKG